MSGDRRYGLPATPWSTSIFGCFAEVEGSLDVWCCGPCSLSRQMKALENNHDTFDLEWCLLGSFCFACSNSCLRVRVVTKYGIDESIPVSVVLANCLAVCSLCQTHREISQRGGNAGLTICRKEEGSYQQMK